MGQCQFERPIPIILGVEIPLCYLYFTTSKCLVVLLFHPSSCFSIKECPRRSNIGLRFPEKKQKKVKPHGTPSPFIPFIPGHPWTPPVLRSRMAGAAGGRSHGRLVRSLRGALWSGAAELWRSLLRCGRGSGSVHFGHRWNGYGSIPINTIFSGMNIHLPAILMFTRGTRFWLPNKGT